MVIADPIVARLLLALAVAMLMLGVVTAWASGNVIKRLIGVAVAMLGAIVALGALAAPQSFVIVAAAAVFAQLVLGAALIVRLQEDYGGVEAIEHDIADDDGEPAEPKA